VASPCGIFPSSLNQRGVFPLQRIFQSQPNLDLDDFSFPFNTRITKSLPWMCRKITKSIRFLLLLLCLLKVANSADSNHTICPALELQFRFSQYLYLKYIHSIVNISKLANLLHLSTKSAPLSRVSFLHIHHALTIGFPASQIQLSLSVPFVELPQTGWLFAKLHWHISSTFAAR